MKILSLGGYLPFPWVIYMYKIVLNFKCLVWNCLSNFHQILHSVFCWKVIDNLFESFHTTEKDSCHYYYLLYQIYIVYVQKCLKFMLKVHNT